MKIRKINYKQILSKENTRILITGDSISYNRYGYDPSLRLNNDAFNFGAGMGSWSFKLRDSIYFSDPQFIFGSEIEFNCPSILGLSNTSEIPNTEVFGGKIKTLLPNGEVEFVVNIKSDNITLYFQQRIDYPCVFDIFVDGRLAVKDYSNKGDNEFFAGFALVTLPLSCNPNTENHIVRFSNIRGENPKITVAGVGAENKTVTLAGRGNQCASFFIENFEERIARYSPDLLILIIGANDRARITIEDFENDLRTLFTKVYDYNRKCNLLLLLPPNAHNPDDLSCNISPFTSIEKASEYNAVAIRVCEEFSSRYDIDFFKTPDLFNNEKVEDWRFDNVHLNNFGNEILYNALLEKFKIQKRF